MKSNLKSLVILMSLSGALAMTACGNKDGSNGSNVAAVPVNTTYSQNCAGGIGTPGYAGGYNGYANGTLAYGTQQPCYGNNFNYNCGVGYQALVQPNGQTLCAPLNELNALGGAAYFPYANGGFSPPQWCSPFNGRNRQCGGGSTCMPYGGGSNGVCHFAYTDYAQTYYSGAGFSFNFGF